jgi:hypothetical protein
MSRRAAAIFGRRRISTGLPSATASGSTRMTGVDDAAGKVGPERFVDELRGTLELSHGGDSAVYLLNPRVTGADGEWETWFFATWSPDVERFRSFEQMMRTRYGQFSAGASDGF